jgi:hypothetical protein
VILKQWTDFNSEISTWKQLYVFRECFLTCSSFPPGTHAFPIATCRPSWHRTHWRDPPSRRRRSWNLACCSQYTDHLHHVEGVVVFAGLLTLNRVHVRFAFILGLLINFRFFHSRKTLIHNCNNGRRIVISRGRVNVVKICEISQQSFYRQEASTVLGANRDRQKLRACLYPRNIRLLCFRMCRE